MRTYFDRRPASRTGANRLRSALAVAVVAVLPLSACAAPPATGAGPATSSAGRVSPGPVGRTDPSGPPDASAPSASAGSASASPVAAPSVSAPSASMPAASAPSAAGPGSVASSGAAAGGVSVPLPQCRAATLATRIPGMLTVAAAPAHPGPWFSGDPADGRGLDAATVAAVAALLGFPADRVRWVAAEPRAAVRDPSGRADLGVGQLVIPDGPSAQIDYSTGYFPVTQVVVTRRSAGVSPSLAGVRGVRVAVAGDSRAAAVLSATPGLTGGPPPSRLADPAAALAAVRSGAADAAAVDILTATAAPDLKILGELPAPVEKAQVAQLGLILPPGSKLTSCVSTAIDVLRVQGSLSLIKARWVPVAPLK